METNYTRIFYAGIAYGAYPEKGCRQKKEGLLVKKLGKEFPYLLGEGRGEVRKLQVYYALLPEYKGKTLLGKKARNWKRETAVRLLDEAARKAFLTLACREQIAAPELAKNRQQVPIELTAACLYRQRPFDNICITLPADGGEYHVQQAIELLIPYLRRIRQVVFKGDENPAYGMLEDYLYEEFGIVAVRTCMPPPGLPWLDMADEEADFCGGQVDSDSLRRISRLETLKFLDTAVKNGYNTKVN